MNARTILMNIFGRKIPNRRSQKVKMKILRKNLSERGLSLVHKEVYDNMPKDGGLFCKKFSVSPASCQTSAGKKMRRMIVNKLINDLQTQKVKKQIGDKSIEILISYHLLKTKKRRDIDNYTKNVIDSLHKGGLFNDDSQVRFLCSKINYITVVDPKYYRALEAVTVRVDFFNEYNKVTKEFNKIFNGGK